MDQRFLKNPDLSALGGKVAVTGIRDRSTGKVKAQVVERTDAPTLQGFVYESTEREAVVYTDEARAYEGLRRAPGVGSSTAPRST